MAMWSDTDVLQWCAKQLAKAGFIVVPKSAIVDLRIRSIADRADLEMAPPELVERLHADRMRNAFADEMFKTSGAIQWSRDDTLQNTVVYNGHVRFIQAREHDAALRDLAKQGGDNG